MVGILKAFQSMSQAGTGGFKVVSQGIAAALVATAAGLMVAIYAIIAYNYFVAKIGAIGVQYKVFCEEFLLALGEYGKSQAAPAVRVASATAGQSSTVVAITAMGMSVQLDDPGAEPDAEGEGKESIVAEINITPLTDVFLVLLIIFMVTSTAMVESEVASRTGVKVALPKANAAGAVTKRRTDPVLTVTKNNELYLLSQDRSRPPRSRNPQGAHRGGLGDPALARRQERLSRRRGRPDGHRQEGRRQAHRHPHRADQIALRQMRTRNLFEACAQ